MDLGLTGKAALVTAASDGLGLACAQRLAEAGCRVAIAARDGVKLEAARVRLAALGDAHAIPADLRRGETIAPLVAEAVRRLGGLDILIVNGGHVAYGDLDALAEAQWYEAFELLVMSAVRLVGAALPHMRARGGGDIVFIGSSTTREPAAHLLSNVMRAGVAGLAKTLAHDAAHDNIRVNVVAPGYFDTGRVRRRVDETAAADGVPRAEAERRIAGAAPMGRLGTAEEFADLVAFVASRRAAYLAGTTITIDGAAGRSLF
ncbi:MAG: SDR family oxidoreductase [Proteobacteria bacterium]|nr:SDR family oxidoreductase [Pseudomonadota bacterium]